MKQGGRSLTDDQCDELWTRIQAKKYAYGFGRGARFIDRCFLMQFRLINITRLRRFVETYNIHANCTIEANTIYLKRFSGEQYGSTDHA